MPQIRGPFTSQPTSCRNPVRVVPRAQHAAQLHRPSPAQALKHKEHPHFGGTAVASPSSQHTQQQQQQQQQQHRQVSCKASRLPTVAFFGRSSDPELTVCKLQVGMFGDVEVYQRQLDRIAGVLDGDDEDAMADLVQDVVVMLNRNLEYCSYAATGLFGTDDFDELEQQYNKACLKERSKFKQETFSNVGGRLSTASLRESGKDVGLDKWLCLTLILAAEATVKLPKIRELNDLKESLNMLGSLSPDMIVAVELLWTPQERGDAYSKDELLIDYPGLVNL